MFVIYLWMRDRNVTCGEKVSGVKGVLACRLPWLDSLDLAYLTWVIWLDWICSSDVFASSYVYIHISRRICSGASSGTPSSGRALFLRVPPTRGIVFFTTNQFTTEVIPASCFAPWPIHHRFFLTSGRLRGGSHFKCYIDRFTQNFCGKIQVSASSWGKIVTCGILQGSIGSERIWWWTRCSCVISKSLGSCLKLCSRWMVSYFDFTCFCDVLMRCVWDSPKDA